MKSRFQYFACLASTFLISAPSLASEVAKTPVQPTLPIQKAIGNLEVVALFSGAMPTGVTVSSTGRKFVNFPHWGDVLEFSVAEIIDGTAVAYPDTEINRQDLNSVKDHLICVQSVVVDGRDRLWIVDAGAPKMGPIIPGAPKLVCVDLKTNKVVQTILIPDKVALKNSYLNDVRFDLSRGKAGMAFLTDSSSAGPNAIIVVDLASGQSFRKLNNDLSVKPVSGFLPIVEGKEVLVENAKGEKESVRIGSDGIAIGADGKRLFYCPLSSRKLYSVSIDALCNPALSEQEVAKTVCEVANKSASDGLESDSAGRIYASDFEHNAVHRLSLEGKDETLVCDPRVLWPDTLSLATDGYLYFIVNQLHRQARFNAGIDKREKPYVLFRVKVDAKPVHLL